MQIACVNRVRMKAVSTCQFYAQSKHIFILYYDSCLHNLIFWNHRNLFIDLDWTFCWCNVGWANGLMQSVQIIILSEKSEKFTLRKEINYISWWNRNDFVWNDGKYSSKISSNCTGLIESAYDRHSSYFECALSRTFCELIWIIMRLLHNSWTFDVPCIANSVYFSIFSPYLRISTYFPWPFPSITDKSPWFLTYRNLSRILK